MEELAELDKSFKHVMFYEKDHSYKIDGVTANYSATRLLKKYQKPFDAQMIGTMVARKRGITLQTLLAEWDFTREYASYRGTEFHKFAENYLLRKWTSIDKDGIKNFLDKNKGDQTIGDYYNSFAVMVKNFKAFYDWWKEDHILVKPEFVVGDKESSVCGTLDNLSYNTKTKKLAIFDYKTNKNLKLKGSKYGKLLAPFEHLPNNDLVKYSLQLHIYKHIIEKHTKYTIDDLYIVWVCGEEGHELIECLDLSNDADLMMQRTIFG